MPMLANGGFPAGRHYLSVSAWVLALLSTHYSIIYADVYRCFSFTTSVMNSARNPPGINPVTSNAIHRMGGPDHTRAIAIADDKTDNDSGPPQRILCR